MVQFYDTEYNYAYWLHQLGLIDTLLMSDYDMITVLFDQTTTPKTFELVCDVIQSKVDDDFGLGLSWILSYGSSSVKMTMNMNDKRLKIIEEYENKIL